MVRLLIATVTLLLPIFIACGKLGVARTYEQRRAETISGNAVFSTGGDGSSEDVNDGRVPEPEPTPGPTSHVSQIPIELFCSAVGLQRIGSALKTSPNDLVYAFKMANGTDVCAFTETGARDDILDTNKINIKDLNLKCPALVVGQNYVVTLKTPTGANSMLTSILHYNDWRRGLGAGGTWIGRPLHVAVSAASVGGGLDLTVTDRGPCDGVTNAADLAACKKTFGTLPAKVLSSGVGANGTTMGGPLPIGAKCDVQTSPLIIRLGDTNRPITLSRPLRGIDFDIMGVNASPAHQPMRISWFTRRSSADDYFLVLPNRRGEVLGIDQMFGDNTVTPDGHKPPSNWNGYAALGLYDGRRGNGSYIESARDGFITKDDPIFTDLRLWHDTNRDGVAQPGELSTLADHRIERIDLKFDPNFVERDRFGNETKMKSTVQTSDGKTHLIYDLWFRALDRSNVPEA